MVLYHVITIYHLFNAIVHRQRYHSDENASIMLPDFLKRTLNEEKCLELKKLNLFDEVYFFPYCKVTRSNSTLKSQINEMVKEILPNSLETYSEIYVWGTHFYFSLELIDKNINFFAAEEANGALSKSNILRDALQHDLFQLEFAEKNGLLDYSNKLIKGVLCNFSSQNSIDITRDKIIDFNVMIEMQALELYKQNQIMRFFEADFSFSQDNNIAVILTQHFMTFDILTYDEQVKIYKIFIDYFLEQKKVLIKPHPSDLLPYKLEFPSCTVISQIAPAELIPFFANKKMDTIATIYSTGISLLQEFFENKIEFDIHYREFYIYTHRYYIALLTALNLSKNKKIACIGTYFPLLVNCLKFSLKENASLIEQIDINGLSEFDVVIIDDLTALNCSKEKVNNYIQKNKDKTTFIFINSLESFFFYDHEQKIGFQKMIPISFTLKDKKDMHIYEKGEVFCLPANENIKKCIEELKMEKNLEMNNAILSCNVAKKDKLKIKILEAKLRATEKRLCYYVDLLKNIKEGANK